MKVKKAAPSQYAPRAAGSQFSKFAKTMPKTKQRIDPLVTDVTVRENSLAYKQFPSRVTPGGSTSSKDNPIYTGSKVMGISLVHKSGFMPVFSDEQAIDFANMRR